MIERSENACWGADVCVRMRIVHVGYPFVIHMQQRQSRLNRIPFNIFTARKTKVAFFFMILALIIDCRFLASF